jgi:hypothetical protein
MNCRKKIKVVTNTKTTESSSSVSAELEALKCQEHKQGQHQ